MDGLCPHLDLRHDPASACLYPTRDHVCNAGHPTALSADHQRVFCLGDFAQCETYSGANVPSATAPEPVALPSPLDPYRTLQLHPRAPAELIEEAYITLVERVLREGGTAATEARIQRLNDAYGLLNAPSPRRTYDAKRRAAR